MKNSIDIVKDNVIPYLENDSKFKLLSNINWDLITAGFLKFENDPRFLINEIEKLGLENSDKILSKLAELQESIVDELAEIYILENKFDLDEPMSEVDSLFNKKVKFFSLLKGVITKLERKRIIKQFTPLPENPIGVLSEKNIEFAFKKKGREDLKGKFKSWDQELKDENIEFQNSEAKGRGKIFSLSRVKYTVAASIVLAVGLIYMNSYYGINSGLEIANLNVSTQETPVLINQGIGYVAGQNKREITISYIDQSERIASFKIIIKDSINQEDFKDELSLLINREHKYTFYKNHLNFYSKRPEGEVLLVELEKELLYFKLKDNYYKLTSTDIPLGLVKESNSNIIEQLEKIIFINK